MYPPSIIVLQACVALGLGKYSAVEGIPDQSLQTIFPFHLSQIFYLSLFQQDSCWPDQIHPDALAVRLTSVTGYGQVFSLQEARLILIATHVGGEVLSHWHGAPARAVVPTRRGWFWIKWLAEVEVLDSVVGILEQPLSIR